MDHFQDNWTDSACTLLQFTLNNTDLKPSEKQQFGLGQKSWYISNSGSKWNWIFMTPRPQSDGTIAEDFFPGETSREDLILVSKLDSVLCFNPRNSGLRKEATLLKSYCSAIESILIPIPVSSDMITWKRSPNPSQLHWITLSHGFGPETGSPWQSLKGQQPHLICQLDLSNSFVQHH